jgi:hypothetical protein
MRGAAIVLFCGMLIGNVARAQVSISEFLRSATEDPEVKTFTEQNRFLQQKTYRLPFLQRLELRTQNRELLANQ